MEKQLGDTLVKRNIVSVDTEIEAWYKANEFGGGTFDQSGRPATKLSKLCQREDSKDRAIV